MKQRIILFILIVNLFLTAGAENPKREFRGAWLHTVGQNHFAERNREGNEDYLREQLDILKEAGVNAVIFQVRPCNDAFYPSQLEPWSKYLTGTFGKAPDEMWDPLEFMIEECHERGMELHAWLNPYRSVPTDEKIDDNHPVKKEPWRYVIFDKRYYFDPGLPENRAFINKVVKDIVTRYDVDAIHMDDYFYPYPVKGIAFKDDKSFAKYGAGMTKNDWRRDNVNKLIAEVSQTIHSTKPWVRFGISPFGIWRNISSDSKGSRTNGLQNYDDLYADVILWAKNGWIDYQVPQLYWELDHKRASSEILADWWNRYAYDRHLYFGQDVERSMNKGELDRKIEISRTLSNVTGNVWWPSVSLTKNYMNVLDELKEGAQSTIALTPEYPWLDSSSKGCRLDSPRKLSVDDGVLSWEIPRVNRGENSTSQYGGAVIYRMDEAFGETDVLNPENIVAVVKGNDNFWIIDESIEPGTWLFVTALDKINRESKPSVPVYVSIDQ